MEETNKFSYSFYEDIDYSCEYDSVEEALEAAKADAKNDDEFKNAKTVYIGRVYRFVPEIEPWNVIERLQDDADDEAYEAAEDYLQYISDDEANKLGKMLTETFNKWAKETNNEPGFFIVKDVVEYSLEGVDADIEVVKEQTPIDTAKHGHWIFAEDMVSYIKCSECGDDICWVNTKRPKYCPSCGSRMDGDNK